MESREWDRAAAAERAARAAYDRAEIEPADVELAEVDDSYAYKQLQHLDALGLAALAPDRVNPSGGALGEGHLREANGLARALAVDRAAPRGRRPRRRGAILARGPLDLGGGRGDAAMSPRVAVVGAGMSRFVRRAQETGKELSWIATREALASCELKLEDVDAVCLTSAPDAFDGVHRKGDYLADGAGRVGEAVHAHLRRRRQRRLHARSRAGTRSPPAWPTSSCAWPRRRCRPASPTRRARSSRSSTTSWSDPSGPNLLWIFALEMQRYMQAYGLDKRDIAQVAVKNKRNAADHPAALLGQADITVEDVLASETLAWPVQRLDVSPISDGAVAIVMASEEAAKRLTDRPVWVQGVGWNLDTTYWTNRDLAYPEYVENAARMAYGMAGVNEPRKEIHVAEPYDPFDYKELHHLEGLLLFDRGKAPEAAAAGVTAGTATCRAVPRAGCSGSGTRSRPPGSIGRSGSRASGGTSTRRTGRTGTSPTRSTSRTPLGWPTGWPG